MGNGGQHNIKPTGGNSVPDVGRGSENGRGRGASDTLPQADRQIPKHPKTNADVLFDKNWHKSQAEARRSDLTTMIAGGENRSPAGRDSSVQRQTEQAKNLLNLSLDDLISLAAEHKDLKSFRSESRGFWSSVKKMSELRTVDTFINGKQTQRVVSRYGDLLALLQRRGGRLENFISSLPRSERNVFLARYQINQTFGANELFAGRGIKLDKNGHFPVDVFLSANGKNAQISAGSVLSLFGGDASGKEAAMMVFFENNGVFANGQFLLNTNSAALLSLSLALYQNANALLAFDELAPEAFSPKTLTEPPLVAKQQTINSKNTFENAEAAAASARRAAGEQLAAGALVNGALATIEKYRKAKLSDIGLSADIDGDNAGFRFSAGATGAMMGATIGCVVPLADKTVGEILGFASSVVVGLTDTGLRSLGANALVSVITSGVQSFLNVSGAVEKSLPQNTADKFLSAPSAASEFYADDLRENLFSGNDEVLLPA